MPYGTRFLAKPLGAINKRSVRQVFISIILSFSTLLATGQTFELTDTVFNEGDILRTYQTHFELGRWRLLEESFPFLDSVVDFMKTNENLEFLEIGYHGTPCKATWSMCLSQKRAQQIVDYLIKKGIEPVRLWTKGYNDTFPIIWEREIEKMTSKEEIDEANRINTRTELKILNVKQK